MRGRTLNNSYIILDEAQNTSAVQMKMFLTRLGINSKMVVTGDLTQIDLPKDTSSGLVQVLEVLRKIKDVGLVKFTLYCFLCLKSFLKYLFLILPHFTISLLSYLPQLHLSSE